MRPEPRAAELARREKVDIQLYEIIYEVIEQVKGALSGLLKPDEVEKSLGLAEVRQVFRVSRAGNIAGCMVMSGTIHADVPGAAAPRWRGGVRGPDLASLKRFKDDVREVATGFECGIGLEGHNDIQSGDTIEAFTIETVAQVID